MLRNYCQALQSPRHYLTLASQLPNAKEVLADKFGIMDIDQLDSMKDRKLWRKLYTGMEPLVVYFAQNEIIPHI
jgi:hypothetical protein